MILRSFREINSAKLQIWFRPEPAKKLQKFEYLHNFDSTKLKKKKSIFFLLFSQMIFPSGQSSSTCVDCVIK